MDEQAVRSVVLDELERMLGDHDCERVRARKRGREMPEGEPAAVLVAVGEPDEEPGDDGEVERLRRKLAGKG